MIKKTIKSVVTKNDATSTTTRKFTLLPKPEIAPKGPQHGQIIDVSKETGTDNGEPFERMDIVVQLDKTDSKGQPFKLTKSYNMGEGGRGIAQFIKDYSSIKDTSMTRTDMYDIDSETLLKTRLVAEVEYKESSKGLVSVIGGFLPVTGQAEQTEQAEQAEPAEPAAESVAA
jgi:hypothetical protein